MTSTHKADSGVCSPSTPVSSTTGSSGHKNSLKGTKLARRARSFKDDLFEKISQMRTPTNTLGRSNSPHSPRIKHTKPHRDDGTNKPAQSLDIHVRQIRNALKHFRDVISKRKLEVLPGNGTVILEFILSMYADIQSYTLNEHSSTLISATTQVYLSLGKLIKLCDEVLLCEDESECASLNNENVKEVVDLVDNAVENLVQLVTEKIKEKDSALATGNTPEKCSSNTLMRPIVDHAAQRTSLPDIPLTPKERDILEKSNSNPMRVSHSSESILRGSSPPPKPPLPNRPSNPPPLPPKRRSAHNNQTNSNADLEYNPDSSLQPLGFGGDHISLQSRSPDDNSSLLSVSAGSLDSALNHSREEEELKALNMDISLEDTFENDGEKIYASKTQLNRKDASFIRSNRHSNESGFASMQSTRASSVSTKRSSQHSVHSQKSSIASSTELSSLRKLEEFSVADVPDQCPIISTTSNCVSSSAVISQFHQQHQQQNSVKCFSSSTQNNQSTFTVVEQNISHIAANNHFNMVKVSSSNENNNSISNSSTFTDDASGDNLQSSFKTEKSINVQSFSSLNKTNSLDLSSDDVFSSSSIDLIPPAIPVKTRKNSNNNIHNRDKHISQYDNFETDSIFDNFNNHEITELRQHSNIPNQWLSKHQSLMDPPRRCNTFGDGITSLENPPPLPQKRKNIIAYMEICSSSTRTAEQLRHSVHTYNVSHSSEHFSSNRNISHSQTMNLSPIRKLSSQLSLGSSSPINEKPPALPPKNKQRLSNNCKAPPTIITTPPPSPKPLSLNSSDSSYENRAGRIISSMTGSEMSTVNEEQNEVGEDEKEASSTNATTTNTVSSSTTTDNTREEKLNSCCSTSDNTNEEDEGIDVVLRNNSYNKQDCSPSHSMATENIPNLLNEIDISNYLIYKKEGEDGPDIKGGHLDALIVHASRSQKKSDNDGEEDAFSEAFITTFRTFIQPLELIEKLTHRYTIFCCQVTDQKQKAAKETFSLLVRVVNDLTSNDLTQHLLTILVEFVYQLVCSGQLSMAKLLRNKIVEKVTLHKTSSHLNEPRNIITNQPTLLDLKSLEIAEQMTLLDAELFQKIEIPEVLLFAKEQCEEKSPNLNKFTEHFNKMSYWARSKILYQMDAKDREKHVIKFIKIMKHLRKMNNYNSYLALLSALDSAPIRRLEWHKTITEGLKEYCALIDSSSSFRVYRQALAETNPPCIPYIGLVLQDLTFVHVGNPDYLKDCIINFSKRWQQHNIIVNMKRFKKCAYPFKRNERIISFFENFENFLGEEQMWQISENIKPRGRRTLQN